MRGVSSNQIAAVLDAAAAAPMLAQVEAWAGVNSGSRNLAGLARMADILTDAFAPLPGALRLTEAAPVGELAVGGAGQKGGADLRAGGAAGRDPGGTPAGERELLAPGRRPERPCRTQPGGRPERIGRGGGAGGPLGCRREALRAQDQPGADRRRG